MTLVNREGTKSIERLHFIGPKADKKKMYFENAAALVLKVRDDDGNVPVQVLVCTSERKLYPDFVLDVMVCADPSIAEGCFKVLFMDGKILL
ncbi:hypothetical protein A3K34_04075 [candidate division WWE3 bacterium RIFOXYC1_FULL_40_10]|uniref:Uncharacterized protein n=1 Tax=candidate division WWE3 bacterium RIFOXYA2_FULL_46_9 TaxID=1802636 RepID=A0A1F4W0S1_UNCKA|nr:MAG: hypothetical protein A3K58_04075 [candidate division WWE3 bacterium RIFOXYB1_FULL_40_22]OGC62018.1 MAG: hypothetical protein A3K37_04075 [candidate division WWE3 bacterium RIFOXYA1_FULL_40_11]OGC62935.1 MAG: hypothetical protein A2264_03590 [candidate division WWE3 bacterium RIFOXYA2_FULL_46_9]OGC65037.1 MAG: hypothetical protein A2326_03300 [candidate division WWE3 bacterium RIFOXYB2_FULL_41_6]OGC66401.1 MAG: hypothetical protein A3K34_04075 [candidate division WWE3 bacterium RIFOXYC1_